MRTVNVGPDGVGARAFGSPPGPSSPSGWTPAGSAPSSNTRVVMSQPRRLRANSRPCVQTRQRNPSIFGSNSQPGPRGTEPLAA